MKKLALWGLWHVHAEQYIDMAKKHAEVVGVWDEDKEKLDGFCREHKVPAFSSLEEMLNSEAEGVIVCTATSEHRETMVTLARAGKHIFTEKVLAITNEDCDAIEAAVRESGVHFAISFPNICYGYVQTLKQIVDSGEIGKVNSIRFKYSHTGASDGWLPEHFYDRKECGGGALIDLGIHGLYVIHYLHGMPQSFKSILTIATANEDTLKKNKDKVEDASVALMAYEDGCIAISESSLVSFAPITLEINGEKGMCFYSCDNIRKKTNSSEFEKVPEVKALPHPLIQFINEDIDPAIGITAAKNITYMVNELYKNQ